MLMWLQGGIAGAILAFVGAWALDLRARTALAERLSQSAGSDREREQWQAALRELPALRTRVSELERELAERKVAPAPVIAGEAPRLAADPPTAPAAAPVAGSDLTHLPDLSDDQKASLEAAGYGTLAAIARASSEDLLAAIDAQPWDMVDTAAWIEYAQKHTGSQESPAVAQSSAAAIPTAAPDDFTRIEGITDDFQAALYDRGITTYAQLAATPPADLPDLIGAQPWDFVEPEAWIAAAKDLA
jgi:predicted flap endonuclease-1-like 5' DNA nuclease